MVTVEPLFRIPSLKPTVRRWLLSEWPEWYGQGGPGDLSADIEAFSQSETALPVGFVALRDNEPVGFGSLKQESIPSHKHLSPWAASGFVVPSLRRQGVGEFMLRCIASHAQVMGYARIYCGTSTSVSLLRRAGWQHLESVIHAGKPLEVYRSGV